MSIFKKYLKILIFLNFILLNLSKTNDGLKINTDLTAGIISDTLNSASSNNNQNQNFVNTLNSSSQNISDSSLEDNHICTKEEEYVEEIRTPSMQPVKIRTSTWCLEFPPRCSNYKTEIREVVKVQNVTKTRTIRFCCAGYEGNISINDTICKPVCRSGCGRGYCLKPDVCSCEPGYMGKHCTQRCDHDHWGLECKNQCQCHNGAACDNKSGICHCTIGWTGEFCEQPCPMGTHGVMCRKACECDNKLCHPQTGACDNPLDPTIAPNATHVMIATLNSTIVNITHNLDRIAKNIVTIATSTTENINLALPPQILELTTAKTIPEVIVIKQDEPPHTPKIIVHQQGSGLLENLHTGAKTPEVIHVITNWPAGSPPQHNGTQEEKINLAGFAGHSNKDKEENSNLPEGHNSDHENSLLTTLLVILLIIMVAIGIGFLYVYRRYHLQKAQVEAALAARNVSLVPGASAPIVITPPPLPPHTNEQHLKEMGGSGLVSGGPLNKSFLKPLPDLPAFTQMVRNKIEGPDLYDSPSNTSSLTSQNPTPTPYAYARKESLYSVVTPKSRKGSMDSHLYDEIRYPTALHQQNLHHLNYPHHGAHHNSPQQQTLQHHSHHTTHHQSHAHQQQQSHHPHSHSHSHHHQHPSTHTTSTTHHVSHLIIPPQNSKYLQVPQISHTSHKVAHI
ncbi:nimrod A isoform 2-T2 [Cochliomyia hominivorax]